MNILLAFILSILLSACGTVSLKDVQESKPPVFKAQVAATPESCGTIPPIPTDIAVNAFYKDSVNGGRYHIAGSFHEFEPTLFKEFKARTKPLDDFSYKVNSLVDDYRLKGNRQSGECAVAFLDDWARNNALLGEMKTLNSNRQSWYHRDWLFSGAAAQYFKVQDLATPEQDARIKWWLAQVMKNVKAYWDYGNDVKQNHYMCSAVGVMQTAILVNDKESYNWAKKAFNYMTGEVKKEGYLPLEITRGSRALYYHNFIMQQMAYMAQLSKLEGEDWWANEKFQKLINFVFESTIDTEVIEKHSKFKQDQYRPDEWGWYGFLQDNDPRRVKMVEFMKKTQVSYISSNDKKFTMKKFPSVKELGGDQQVIRDLIEQKVKTTK